MATVTAKCCNKFCKTEEELSAKRLTEAQSLGALMCDKCGMPMEIRRVEEKGNGRRRPKKPKA